MLRTISRFDVQTLMAPETTITKLDLPPTLKTLRRSIAYFQMKVE
jgi:hypothetical protein